MAIHSIIQCAEIRPDAVAGRLGHPSVGECLSKPHGWHHMLKIAESPRQPLEARDRVRPISDAKGDLVKPILE